MERNDYKADFDPIWHLTEKYSDPSSPTNLFTGFIHDNLHKFFHSVPLPQAELKLLDFGCGPVIANVISASQYVSDIVLAEYTPQGRVLLEQWLKRDPSFTFDWSPHFKYIVQTLEGRSEAEVKEREESLCQKIKAIVQCSDCVSICVCVCVSLSLSLSFCFCVCVCGLYHLHLVSKRSLISVAAGSLQVLHLL